MLLAELYFYLLLLISLWIFIWALKRPERVYQFPFAINAIFISFIIPQCLSLYLSPGPSVTQEMVERYFLMSCLCLFMSWLGYQIPSPPSKNSNHNVSLSYRKFISLGIFFVVVAYIANILITIIGPAAVARTGPVTILSFFRRWIFYGFAALLLSMLSKVKTIKDININRNSVFLIAALYLILTLVFRGRREPTMALIYIVGSLLYFKRKIIVPRIIPIALVIAILFINPMIGNIRNILASGNYEELHNLNPIEISYNYFIKFHETKQHNLLEVRNGALLMDLASEDNSFGLGTGYWDAFIKYYIPGQIIGKDIKESYKFNLTDRLEIGERYKYNYIAGQTFTGIADSFVEFYYLGCLLFFGLACIYKRIWCAAISGDNSLDQFTYSVLITPSMLVVTHGTQRFVRDIVLLWILIFIASQYCLRKKSLSQKEITDRFL